MTWHWLNPSLALFVMALALVSLLFVGICLWAIFWDNAGISTRGMIIVCACVAYLTLLAFLT